MMRVYYADRPPQILLARSLVNNTMILSDSKHALEKKNKQYSEDSLTELKSYLYTQRGLFL